MADCKISEQTRARVALAWPGLLEDIAAGGLVKDALEKHGVSYGEIRAFIGVAVPLRQEWELAREQSADALAELALQESRDTWEQVRDINGNPLFKEDGTTPLIVRKDAAHARTRIDTLKWAARTRNPRIYSDKSTVDLNVRTVDLNRIIADANARLEASRAVGRVLEGEIVRAILPAQVSADDAQTLADLL